MITIHIGKIKLPVCHLCLFKWKEKISDGQFIEFVITCWFQVLGKKKSPVLAISNLQ
jgi:hypothetical protein